MKKLLSVLLAVCMVFSMITVSAVSVGAADVGKGASTGASEKTIYVGVINYLKLKESDYQVRYWNGSGTGDAALTATGETVQQAVGSAYWNNAAQTFKMYTATIPAEATGYKLHNGNTWFGENGDTAKNNTAYLFEYGGKHYAYYTTTEEPATEATEATTVAPVTRDHHFYVDFAEVIASGTTWYAWTWGEKSTGEWRPVEKFGYVSCHEYVLFASFAADTAPNWDSALSQTEDFTVEDDGRLRVLNEKDEQGHYKVKWNTEEPSTAAPATEAPTTVEPATDTPARLADGYYLIGIKGWDVDSIDAAQKFTENPGAEDEYLLETTLAENDTIKVVKVEKDVITEWYPDGTGNEYKVDKAHSGDVTIYFRTTEKDEWKEFGGYFYVAAPEVPTEEPTTEAPATEVPATEAPTTVEPATEAPARLADGYYLIGIKGWDVDSIDAAQKFTENPDAEDEYLLETTLAENDTIKVVKVEKDVIAEWYPDGTENEYKVDKAHSGDVTIYFQTTEKDEWKEFGGYFYVAAPEVPTEEPTTEAPTTDAPVTEAPATEAPATEVKEIELTGDYYLVGFIDGKDSYGTDHPFKDGKATITTSEASYFIVTDGTNHFMTKGWLGEVTEATLYNKAILGESADKLMAPAGIVTFTLKAYSDGTYKLSYTVEEAPATEASTTVEPATDAPAKLADGYYLIGIKGWDVASIDAAQKFTENPGAEDEYLLETTLAENDTIKVVKVEKDVIAEWYPDGTENEYKVDKAHSGDVTIYFQTTGKAEWKEFGGYFYVAAPEVPTDEPATEAPATEEPGTKPATDAPAKLADGYYLIGIKGWDVDSIDAAQKFTENPGAEDEYMLETTLAENDTIKVVKVEKDVIAEWYPDGTENEYKVDKAHSGEVTIYFQTTEKAEWKEFGGYFYVAAPEAPTDEPATEEPGTEPATDAPAKLADGYYLIGIKGWDVDSIDAAQKFTENPGAEDEYLLETTLAENDTIKVVKVEKDVITEWYPDGTENEYKVDKAHSGEVTIYFQTTEKADWKEFGGYFYVAAPDEPLIGDVDGNGRVTIEDATMLQRYLAEFIDLTDDQKARADVTEDGRLSIKDVTAIQRMIAELPYK